MRTRREPGPREPGTAERERWPGTMLEDWGATDEASWESFPASDPPATRKGAARRAAAEDASPGASGTDAETPRA